MAGTGQRNGDLNNKPCDRSFLHTCPKSIHARSQGGGVFSVAAYFGTEAGEPKGRNPAVNGAREGEVSVAERMPRLLDEGCVKRNLFSGYLQLGL